MAVAERAGSWADWVSDRADRAPIPAPLIVLAVALFVGVLFETVRWADGVATGSIVPLHLAFAAIVPLMPWLIGSFNRAAARAVREATPLVIAGPEHAARLEADIVRAPRFLSILPALLFLPVAIVRFSAEPGLVTTVGLTTGLPAMAVQVAILVLAALAMSAYAVKIATLAYKVHRITVHDLRVDLWNLSPALAFSMLTARMAGATVLLLTMFVVAAPDLYSDGFGLLGLGVVGSLIVVVFALPLFGLHERLAAAKQAAQGDAARQMEDTIGRLRTALAEGDMGAMVSLNNAIAAVDVAQRAIDRVPTWPWSMETFRWVVGALMFPVVLFLTQVVLTRVLGT